MSVISFTKMQGLGNDFIVINNINYGLPAAYYAARASRLCDRHFGIGADGLALLERGRQAPFYMRIFNADGSEAEMCGNAIRCLARFLWERGMCNDPSFSLETGAGLKEVSVLMQGKTVQGVRVDMGRPVLESTEIPVAGPLRHVMEEPIGIEGEELFISAVSMGNPHCVIFLPDLEKVPWQRWGEILESNPLFPRRTNVEFVRVINPAEVEVKVWERGAGPTLACGTGACAVVVAGVVTERLSSPVMVHLPGGALQISWERGGSVIMEGTAEEVYSGNFPI